MSSLLKLYTDKLKELKQSIDPQALQILKRLKDSGYQAYLVGGGVRDLLVNLKPKDFDIATNALPNEVKKKVPYTFIIGRRFKLVHAKRGDQIYEIATFRRTASEEEIQAAEAEERAFVEENFFGNIEEDSFRRDFTINSLFYDPISEEIVDHCSGLKDIQTCTLRMIGSPKERLLEDPIRILRAIRLSQKLNFSIDSELRQTMQELKDELKKAAAPRKREEWIKFFRLPKVDLAFMELYDLGILSSSLPTLHKLFTNDDKREDFLGYIRNIKYIGFNLSDNVELYSAILQAYLKSEYPNGFNINDLAESVDFIQFCRDELGIFKAEFGTYFQAAQFVTSLKKPDNYLKRGERRQKAMVNHPTFSLSLKMAFFIHELSASELVFWLKEKERFST